MNFERGEAEAENAERQRLKDQLANLSQRLEATEQAANDERPSKLAQDQNFRRSGDYSKAVAVLGEFIGAIAVCSLAGLGLDRWLGSAPWGLAVMLILGFCAGLWSAYKAVA